MTYYFIARKKHFDITQHTTQYSIDSQIHFTYHQNEMNKGGHHITLHYTVRHNNSFSTEFQDQSK